MILNKVKNFYLNIPKININKITTLVINKLLGVSEVGVYNVIAKFGTLVTQVTGPLTQSLFPELSKIVAKDDEKGAFLIVKKIYIYSRWRWSSSLIYYNIL